MSHPTAPQPGYRSATTLARWASYGLAFYALSCAARLWFFVSEHGAMEALADQGNLDRAAMAAFESRAAPHDMVAGVLALAMTVLWCMWTYRVAKNARGFGVAMRTTPGWAVGWYFIPIAHLWKPYTALREVWQVSSPEPAGATPSRVPGFFVTWWLTSVAVMLVKTGADLHLAGASPDVWLDGLRWRIAELQIELVSCALTLLVCWRLTRRQDERAGGVMPRAELHRS